MTDEENKPDSQSPPITSPENEPGTERVIEYWPKPDTSSDNIIRKGRDLDSDSGFPLIKRDS